MSIKVNLLVNGVKFENLSEKEKEQVKSKATDIAADWATDIVKSMIVEGKSQSEIEKFLDIKKSSI